MRILSVLLLLSASFAWAQHETSAESFQDLRRASERGYSDLESFVCDERIDRFRSSLGGDHVRSIDRIAASLSFESGKEHYGDIRRDDRPITALSNLPGAWSEGEFGSLLRQTGLLLQFEELSFLRYVDWNDATAALYSFDVASRESPWELAVEGRVYRIGFNTELLADVQTGKIVRIRRTAIGIPAEAGISSIEWSVSLEPVLLNGAQWLLPAHAEYSVSYARKNRREWNVMTFGNYRRYGSAVAIRFDPPR